MNLVNRNHIFILLMIVVMVLSPLLTVILYVTMPDNLLEKEDNATYPGDFLIVWGNLVVQDLAVKLILGISVFILFVTYLGGRSNHRRFYDQIPDSHYTSKNVWLFLKTALDKAVFIFFCFLQFFQSPNLTPESSL